MPCLICGEESTVRSHIIPKAVTRDLRRGFPHAIQGSSNFDGIKKTPGGAFSDDILCGLHEGSTSRFDTYGVAFLRRAKEAFDAFGPDTFWVENPEPETLSRFVAAVIWREVHTFSSQDLGPYEAMIRQHVFDGGQGSWPILVWRDNFYLENKSAIEFNTHPYRTKFNDRNAWMFTALGFSFVAISDKRGTSIVPKEMIASQANPVKIMVGNEMDYRSAPNLQPIFDKMKKPRKIERPTS